MKKKFKVYQWDIDDTGLYDGSPNYLLYWEGNNFITMLWKLFRAKNHSATFVRLEWR